MTTSRRNLLKTAALGFASAAVAGRAIADDLVN